MPNWKCSLEILQVFFQQTAAQVSQLCITLYYCVQSTLYIVSMRHHRPLSLSAAQSCTRMCHIDSCTDAPELQLATIR